MTIYSELLERVENGEPFTINLQKRNLKINGKYIIKEGVYDENRMLIADNYTPDSVLSIIENLYENYKFSLPSERSDNKKKKYFFAYSIDEIPDEKFFANFESREKSRARLEGFILLSVLNGKFTWNDSMGKWFWQSKIDKDLIILKQWII